MPKKTIEQMYDDKVKRIDKAIAMKEKSIAYFNSLNAAIGLFGQINDKSIFIEDDKSSKKFVIKWRDWFFEQWQEWYMEQTAPQPIKDPFKINEEFERRMKEDKQEGLCDELNRQASEEAELQKGQEISEACGYEE